MDVAEKAGKSCCAPAAGRADAGTAAGASVAAVVGDEVRRVGEDRERMLARTVALPGGTFLMGTEDAEGFPQDGEGPVREVTVDAFRIDAAPVTNEVFREFVLATGYRTEAERYGWSFVFWSHLPAKRFHELVEDTVAVTPWWCKVRDARWDAPEGPGSSVAKRARHPVVHVTWNDAQAFCAWSGQTLPTEAQWEYAARGGLVGKLYPWGDKLRPKGEHRCNIWQGEFPRNDTADDGYSGTCPVDAFAPNEFGLYSVSGNTWEWCRDWFSRDFHATAGRENPQGPPGGETRVMKGGSFLCHKSYCNRYRVGARSANTPDSSTSNIGFRCVLEDMR